MPPNTHSVILIQPDEAKAQTQRRKLLALLLASPVLSASWAAPMAQEAGAADAATAGEKFMTLSVFATGRSKLDPELGASLLAALRASDASFAAAVDDLAADASSGKYSDVEGLEAGVRGTPKHAALLALISAWYTGTVSVNGQTRFVALGNALMYPLIADGSHIPGNCAGAVDSWGNLPLPALSAMPPL